MSAGAEREAEAPPAKGKVDEAERSERGGRVPATIKRHWCLALRLLELVLAIVCIGLIADTINTGRVYTSNNHMSHVATIYTTYCGFIIITAVLVLGASLGEPIGWRTSIAFSVIGAILFVATGGLIISDWSNAMYHSSYTLRPHRHHYDMMCASGIFAVFNAAVFILHAVLTFRKESDM